MSAPTSSLSSSKSVSSSVASTTGSASEATPSIDVKPVSLGEPSSAPRTLLSTLTPAVSIDQTASIAAPAVGLSRVPSQQRSGGMASGAGASPVAAMLPRALSSPGVAPFRSDFTTRPPSSATFTTTASSSAVSSEPKVFPTHVESGHPVSVNMDSSGSTLPAWLETCAPPSRATYPPLESDIRCDVVIIGAGVAGLQVAYELSTRQSNLNVVVIDDGAIASGESGRTTAHLTNAFDDHYFQIKKVLGTERAKKVADSHTWAIDRFESICEQEGIDCEFVRLNAHMMQGAPSDRPDYSDSPVLQEYEAAQSLGVAVHLCEQSAATPSFKSGTTLIFERQAQFHPLKYITQLAERLVKRGVRIHCGTHASKVHGGSSAYVQTTAGHTIRAAHIVEATNIPISNKLAIIDQCMPFRTYAVALYIPRGSGEPALVYDMDDPYHYVRRTPATEHMDLLIVGGEDHKVGDDTTELSLESRFNRLEQWTRHRFPEAKQRAYCWSGQVIEPTDHVALIGRNAVDHDNVYVVTGDSGNGFTHAAIAGRVISELITRSDSPWADDVYNPRRFSHKLSTLAMHNAHVGMQYMRWLQGSDVKDIEEMPVCHGAVVSCRLPVPSHVAVYKDDTGKLHKMSAVCPHAYGIVKWNPLEHSWDCPAHGSRFTPFGKVVNGPACSDLKPLEDKSTTEHAPAAPPQA